MERYTLTFFDVKFVTGVDDSALFGLSTKYKQYFNIVKSKHEIISILISRLIYEYWSQTVRQSIRNMLAAMG